MKLGQLAKYYIRNIFKLCFGFVFKTSLFFWTSSKGFRTTIMEKIYETNFRFHVKWQTTGKVQFPFFSSFLLVSTKVTF